MGYQIGVTPLQMARGERHRQRRRAGAAAGRSGPSSRATPAGSVPRRVLRRVMSPRDGRGADRDPGGRRRARHREDGADRRASRVAGKTGTSAKLVENGRYSEDATTTRRSSASSRRASRRSPSSWSIDTPRAGSNYGGVVAGPDLPAHRRPGAAPPRRPADRQPGGSRARPPRRAPARSAWPGPARPVTIAAAAAGADGELVLPELRGLSGREALRRAGAGWAVGARHRRRRRPRPGSAGRDAGRAGRQLPARARAGRCATGRGVRGAAPMTLGRTALASLGDLAPDGVSGLDAARRRQPVKAVVYDSRQATSGSAVRGAARREGGRHGVRGPGAREGRAGRRVGGPRPADVAAALDCRAATPGWRLRGLAAAFYGHPSRELRVVGITGTNGKTTTAYLVSEPVRGGGHPLRHARHGRLPDRRRGARRRPARRPEAADIQQMLREMVKRRVRRLRDGGVVARARPAPRRRGSSSPPASSRTSRATTSTTTATWSRTSGRSAGCSRCCQPDRRRS